MKGLIKFESYEDKLTMMNTPIFILDMKLYKQDGNIKFFDSDFANVLQVSSDEFDNKTFNEVC